MWKQGEAPRLGLALSGGAARCFAHLGVLRALEAENIKAHLIAGTSAGALVGGAYAAGLSVNEIESFGKSLRWRDMGRLTLSRGGLQSNSKLEEILRRYLPVTRFEDLRLPLAVIATDLRTGAPVVLKDTGDLAFAIRASCTLPGLYVPVVDERNRQLVDGGLVANVPVEAARSLGADVVIAVDVNHEGAKFLGPPQTVFGVLVQAMLVVQRTVATIHTARAEVAVRPRVGHIRWDEINRADELIAAGEAATHEAIGEIKSTLHRRTEEAATETQRHREAKG